MFVISSTHSLHRMVRPVLRESLPCWQTLRSKLICYGLLVLWRPQDSKHRNWERSLSDSQRNEALSPTSTQNWILPTTWRSLKVNLYQPRHNWDYSFAPSFDCHLVNKNCSWVSYYVGPQILSYRKCDNNVCCFKLLDFCEMV